MATYNKHNQFVEDLCHQVHDFTATTGDAITAYLTNTLPTAANSVLLDLTAVVTTNLSSQVFPAGTRTSGQTAGTYTLLLPDLIITATGAVADFRYAGFYNDTPTSPADPLVGWWDYGSTITGMATDETFTYNFTTSTFTLS